MAWLIPHYVDSFPATFKYVSPLAVIQFDWIYISLFHFSFQVQCWHSSKSSALTAWPNIYSFGTILQVLLKTIFFRGNQHFPENSSCFTLSGHYLIVI